MAAFGDENIRHGVRRLQHLDFALALVVIAFDRDRLNDADIQLAGDDGGRHKPATGDGDDALPLAQVGQPPGQGLGIAVQFFPGDGEILLRIGDFVGHGRRPISCGLAD